MDAKEKIIELLIPILAETNLFLVDLSVKGSKMQPKVLVLIDADAGILVDDCAEVSRKLGDLIEEQELISSKYILEVSSPGVDFPLIFLRQYHRHVGRTLEIKLKDGEKLIGKLIKVENDVIEIIEDKKRKKKDEIISIGISFETIAETLVQVSFK